MLQEVGLLLSLCAVMLSGPLSVSDTPQTGESACALVADALKEFHKLRPGDSREHLERIFELDGGLQSSTRSRYAFKRCRFVKVDIEFSATRAESPGFPLPTDKIVNLSRLYLEEPVYD